MTAFQMTQPRVKPEHLPFRIADGKKIRIGGVSYGLAGEVEDKTGSVWVLLHAMDGSRSIDEIVQQVLDAHPDESVEAIRRAIDLFVDSGYVEDAAAPVPVGLTERDQERYSRSLLYYRWAGLTPQVSSWDPQAVLKQASVTVVGVGGTGGVAAMALAASGVGRLFCVEPDVVELSNLNRQVLYTEDDIGKPKVEAAVDRLRRLNSDIEIDGKARTIEGVDDLQELAADCDVLLLSADRPMDIRNWANRACLATGTPWVNAGYHGPLVSFGVFVPGEGACFECQYATMGDEWDALGGKPGDGQERGAAVANAVAAPSAGISGYLAAQSVVSLLTGIPEPTVGKICAINLAALDAPFTMAHPRRADCEACGEPA